MAYDFVVVGGGIGGLTTAALLATRGGSVCLLERQSQVGGCIGRVEFSGHDFEPGMGLYSGFGSGEIFDQVLSELSIRDVVASPVASNYVIRLPDGDFEFKPGDEFESELKRVFPECAREAIEFYKRLSQPQRRSRLPFFSRKDARKEALLDYLPASERFRSFIQVQLRALLHRELDQCTLGIAGGPLNLVRGPLYAVKGGTASLAELLATAIRNAGGTVRLNSPVLRLAFNQSGDATGVDLLSGETIEAKRAIISNLTIWDTYGKLIGLNRTPAEVKKLLSVTHGSGAYLIYASMERSALARLPGERLLVSGDAEGGEFTFAAGTGPTSEGKVAVTLKTRTDVNDWFRFHSSEEDFAEWDQAALEEFWARIHRALPELGGDIEVIETANPRTFYDQTRRKLGMVLGSSSQWSGHSTTIPNLFMVGDTVPLAPNLHQVVTAATSLVDNLI
jgi:phytoene dehydrogenase-like protein